MINEIQHTARQHNNNSFRGQGGSRFEPQPKGYGMSQNHHFECPQATFDSMWRAYINIGHSVYLGYFSNLRYSYRNSYNKHNSLLP